MGKKSTPPPQPTKKSKDNNTDKDEKDPVKPPMKQVLFGSWTGKTPASLLYEHCQKQGWEKPIFNIVSNLIVEAVRKGSSMPCNYWKAQQENGSSGSDYLVSQRRNIR